MGGCQALGPSRLLLGLRGGCGARLLKIFITSMNSKISTTSSAPWQQNKRLCPGSDDSDTDTNTTSVFPRWLVIEAAEPDHSLSKLSPFALGKALHAQIGTLKTIKRLQRGDILVETEKPSYSRMLLGLTQLAGVPVKVSPHRSLNTSRGVIRSRYIAECNVEEIVEELQPQGWGLQVHLRTCMKRSSPAVATVTTTSVKDGRSAMALADVSCTQPPVADERRRNSSGEPAISAEEPGVRSPRFPAKRARIVKGRRISNPTGDSPVVSSSSVPLNDTPIAGCPHNAGALDCRETATVRISCRLASSGVPDQFETLDVAYKNRISPERNSAYKCIIWKGYKQLSKPQCLTRYRASPYGGRRMPPVRESLQRRTGIAGRSPDMHKSLLTSTRYKYYFGKR